MKKPVKVIKKARNSSVATERLQKVLASMGVASRRKIEELIKEERIKVNGKIASLGTKVSIDDKILVDNKPVKLQQKRTSIKVLAYHKLNGEVCSKDDPIHKDNVFANLPRLRGARWVMVGRLDINTTGLLLFTNDGEFANELMHPRNGYEREYAVRIRGEASPEMLKRLTQGIMLDDGLAKCERVWSVGGEGTNKWYHMVIKEGRYREIKRMWEALGITVSRLTRVRFGGFFLPRNLFPGKTRFLTEEEIALLQIKAPAKASAHE